MRSPSPTVRLLAGLAVTLLAVGLFSVYSLRQIAALQQLQTDTIDRNRRDTLQLLRIQNNLNNLAQAMHDMLDNRFPYPVESFQPEFERIRYDLEDALRLERALSPSSRPPTQQAYLASALEEYWQAAQDVFALAREGRVNTAHERVRSTLEPRHASVSNAVARLLVMNNEVEQEAARQTAGIYRRVEWNFYWLLAATVAGISSSSLYLILSNRRHVERLARLSEQRQVLARKLISMQEEVLHSVSRELHDEFGQVLTAVGAMLRRAERRDTSGELRELLRETRSTVQTALDTVRSLSQRLHPSILDDYGLEGAAEWYVGQLRDQAGLGIHFESTPIGRPVPQPMAIHVYRILQEALNNVVRHAATQTAWVRLRRQGDTLLLEVEDHGVGMPDPPGAGGLGLIAMRERAELVNGRLEFRRPLEGGTLVRLEVPLLFPSTGIRSGG